MFILMIQYWTKKTDSKKLNNLLLLPQILMKFQGLDMHRKWLFSLIIVVKVPLVVAKSLNFLKGKFSELPKNWKFLWIFFTLILYPNLWLVFC